MKLSNQNLKFYQTSLEIPDNIQIQIQKTSIQLQGPLGSIIIQRQTLDPAGTSLFRFEPNGQFQLMSNQYADLNRLKSYFQKSIQGLLQGYLIHLELVGVGFRVEDLNLKTSFQQLEFKLGYSHPVYYKLPDDVRAIISSPTNFSLYGVDSARLTQVAARIRKLRPPELYKGKGIRRSSDILFLKERT